MERGFFGSLFDLSFTSFVTTKLIKVLYVLSLVILGISYLFITIGLLAGDSAALGILWLLVIGPLFLFFYTLLYRVVFELVVVLFRIFENTRDQLAVTRASLGNGAPSAPVPPPPAPAGGLGSMPPPVS